MSVFSSQGSTGHRPAISGYLWVILPVITGASLAQALMRQGLPVLYPFIQQEFGLSRAQVGFITSALAFGGGALAVLAGWLTDRLGVKRMITISLLTMMAFILVFPLAGSFAAILALVVLIALVTSAMPPATARAVVEWFPGHFRAMAMGFKQAGIPIAGALTAAILPTLATISGWRMAAASTGLLVLVIAIAFIWLYRDTPQGKLDVHKSNMATLKTIFCNRSLLLTLIWGAIFVGLQFIVMTYFMLFGIEALGLSAIVAGGLLAIVQVSSIVSRIIWGAVSDFYFRRRRAAVLAIIGLITVAWMLVASMLTAAVPRAALYLLAVFIGASTTSFQGVFATIVGENAEAGQVGLTLGVATMMNNVCMLVLPPLFGYLVDVTGSYSLGWRAAAAVALACTLALFAFGHERRTRPAG